LLLNATFPTMNFMGQRGGPSDLFILYDADDKDYTLTDPARRNEDYPDEGDNHGKEGANLIFCDGHAAWVTQKNYLWSQNSVARLIRKHLQQPQHFILDHFVLPGTADFLSVMEVM
jgi:prepilin-type processing-associated H-X9-DG protein